MKKHTIESIRRFADQVTEALCCLEQSKDIDKGALMTAESALFRALVDEEPLNEFQQRVLDEKCELETKCNKLVAFIAGDVFRSLGPQERSRLNRQLHAMRSYANVLQERIDSW